MPVRPEISVIMPVFNRRDTVERSVRSVLQQQGASFEFLLVDDGSDRPAESLYREVEDSGNRVIRSAHNLGPGSARNLGAKEARGEWLAFLDSDDHWLPGKLSTHLSSLRDSGLRIGQAEEIWYRDGDRVNPPKAHRIRGGDLFLRSLRAVCVSSSTVMLRRDLFWEFGGFDEEFFVCEDYDLWLRVSAREQFEYCREPLVVKYGGHVDQLSKALPALDRFRILSIVKGLESGLFDGRADAAFKELERKLRILSKGSAKRGKKRAVGLCNEIGAASEEGDMSLSLALSRELITEWPTRP
jgi:glycosyltransferase involved in cell wall biosynthesis